MQLIYRYRIPSKSLTLFLSDQYKNEKKKIRKVVFYRKNQLKLKKTLFPDKSKKIFNQIRMLEVNNLSSHDIMMSQ